MRRAAAVALVLALAGCSAPPRGGAPALRFLGGVALERQAEGVMRDFGGISGLDRDPASGTWYLLSDDRSARAPARLYTAAIEIDAAGIRSARITGLVALTQPDGSVFPGPAQGGEVPDPEALRFDPRRSELVWSSEGDRRRGLQPFVRRAATDGRFIATLPLPDNLRNEPDVERGVRDNLGIEGLAFAPDAASLWVAMEAPLYEDGPLPSLQQGGFARFTRLDRQGRVLGQYAYPLDAIPAAPSAGQGRADNGVSEILASDAGTLLVVERSGREVGDGLFRFAVRLYEARVDDASDVSRTPALAGASFVAMRKCLVLDLAKAGIDSDNIEAAAWGPRLPNGHATLLLAADDNFHPGQANRLLAFELQGPLCAHDPPARSRPQ